MIIEIERESLLKEPWVTARDGKLKIEPAILSSISELPRGYMVAIDSNKSKGPLRKFRIVDNSAPCYEFSGKASLVENGIALSVEDQFKVLR